MGRVHDQDGVELKANRARLDTPHTGQEQRGQHLLVANSAPDTAGHDFQQVFPLGIFNQPNERFDIRAQMYFVRRDLGLRRRDRRQRTEKRKIAQPGQGSDLDGVGHEIAACRCRKHLSPPSKKCLPGQVVSELPGGTKFRACRATKGDVLGNVSLSRPSSLRTDGKEPAYAVVPPGPDDGHLRSLIGVFSSSEACVR